jgi:hypothetical protein
MSTDFVPLFAALQAKAAGKPANGAPFSPGLPGAAAAAPAPPAPSPGNGAPSAPPIQPPPAPCTRSEVKVELQRENGFIKQIRIECKCGEVIELDCEY